MQKVKFLLWNTFYNILISLRIKQSLFFTVFFPVLIFTVFSFLWGNNGQDYVYSLLTGVICMTVATDGLFVIGSVLKDYYRSGFIKYINKFPIPITLYIFSLALSRLMIVFLEIMLLILISVVVFKLNPLDYNLYLLFLGAAMGMVIYAFLGLCIHFVDLRNKGGEKGLVNILYFGFLFTSDAFYPTSQLNSTLGTIANYLPFNPILTIMRGYLDLNWFIVLFWFIIPLGIFSYIFERYKIKR